ncbi:chemotaxis protein CheA [Allosalinactinospora lopnorensis]|uniref:chemotaxis protein CheA n=1 Tax=Allosalinactinospora lopnorensis TaxID=1352348 RepID=UPI000A824186|nr:chemotaxis protein CheA [Allosalinactinospora lopnorensis]
MLRRLVTTALLTAGFTAVMATSAGAAEAPSENEVADALQSDHLYVEESITDEQFPQEERDALAQTAESADSPVYYVLLSDGTFRSQTTLENFMDGVMDEVGDGVYAGFAGSQGYFVESPNLEESAVQEIGTDARAAGNDNQADTLAAIPDAIEAQESGEAASAVFGAVLLGLLALAIAGGGYFLYSSKKKREAQKAKELAEIKQMANEDVVRLGEDVARLDIDLGKVDDATRTDYSNAMDSYDRAKTLLDTIKEPQEIQQVTNALEDGRYSMVATRARMNGEPVPERRQPCFFNPQHGPSQQDVMWAPPGGTSRSVPACASCAQAVLSGHDPDVRMVEVDGQRRPYYDAGPAYAPYAGGYFGMDMMMGMFTGMMMGSMMGSMMGGGMMAGDMGGDMGGGDFGDFGGGDFGGFDF